MRIDDAESATCVVADSPRRRPPTAPGHGPQEGKTHVHQGPDAR